MSKVETALRVFIVDDEPPARNRLRDLLNDCNKHLLLVVVGEAGNGQEALDQLQVIEADVVLLDIRMPQMDGIELAQHLQKLPLPPLIVFTTAYDDSAIKAFELHAADYLLKPIRKTRLLEALNRVFITPQMQAQMLRAALPAPRRNFSIHERGKIILIPIGQVLYLRAELKYITVRTAEREYLIEETLTELEKEFTTRFVRIHRNCLVAKEAISGFEKASANSLPDPHSGSEDGHDSTGWMVKLQGLDELLTISRRQQHIVREFG